MKPGFYHPRWSSIGGKVKSKRSLAHDGPIFEKHFTMTPSVAQSYIRCICTGYD